MWFFLNHIQTTFVVEAVTEEELRQKESITPDDVLKLNKITEGKPIMCCFKTYSKKTM